MSNLHVGFRLPRLQDNGSHLVFYFLCQQGVLGVVYCSLIDKHLRLYFYIRSNASLIIILHLLSLDLQAELVAPV